jgi:hypothetical protein
LRINTNEHDVLDTQLAILDLGDVLELGTKTVYAPERDAVGEIHLTNRWRFVIFKFV